MDDELIHTFIKLNKPKKFNKIYKIIIINLSLLFIYIYYSNSIVITIILLSIMIMINLLFWIIYIYERKKYTGILNLLKEPDNITLVKNLLELYDREDEQSIISRDILMNDLVNVLLQKK